MHYKPFLIIIKCFLMLDMTLKQKPS